MPSIVIRERDLSTVPQAEVLTNAVYIPGYAIKGPVNEATLCTSLTEFRDTFGDVPYKFTSVQAMSSISTNSSITGNFYNIGDYEKSYIIASELLNQGMPVLYERVMDETKANNLTYIYPDSANYDAVHYTNFGDYMIGYEQGYFLTSATITEIPANTATEVDVYAGYTEDDHAKPQRLIGTFTVLSTSNISLETDWSGVVTPTQGSAMLSADNFTVQYKLQCESANPGPYYGGIKIAIEQISTTRYEFVVTYNGESTNTIITTDQSEASDTIHYYEDMQGRVDNSGLVRIVTMTWPFDLEQQTLVLRDPSVSTNEFDVVDIYKKMYNATSSLFDKLTDRGEYQLRFITSGAYAPLRAEKTDTTYGTNIANKMLEVASARGDCVALIDDLYTGKIVDLTNENSTYAVVKTFADERENELTAYGAVFTPYARYTATTIPSSTGTFRFDTYASFAYLYAYANAIKDNGEWNAVAGFERGTLRNCVELLQPITNAIADAVQPRDDVAINPICYIKPRGLVIWGSRTLLDNSVKGELTAQSFLNIRQLCSSIKRQTWYTCKSLTFEQNTDILWFNFKGQITPLLDKMVSGGGIQSYSIVRIKTQKKATVVAKITIAPIEPVEDWDITLELTDGTAIITE